ncbi:MAG TPA: hypothetical protein VF271_10810 [Rhodanobacteraceae bacterium]
MRRSFKGLIAAMAIALLAGCSSQPSHSMFPPTLGVQQLRVTPDGHWHMRMRILNNSYGSMDFRRLQLTMTINGKPAAHIDTRFKLDIAPLSADLTNVDIAPSQAASKALAAIADEGSSGNLAYTLTGTATAIPEGEKKLRQFKVKSRDWLSPVPGVANTYR